MHIMIFSELDKSCRNSHKPGKPGILRDFSEHGKLMKFSEFCPTSGKNYSK